MKNRHKVTVMKKESQINFMPMSKEELAKLTLEIKEILAADIAVDNHKIFSSADLWNIQRQKRKNPGRRFLV